MKYLHQQPIKQFLLVRLDLAPGQKLRAVDICGHLMLDGDRLKQFVLVANPDFESENTSFGDRSALFDQRLSARTRFSTVTQAKAAHLLTPPEWRISRTSGFGPFVTFVEYEVEDGTIREWQSRRHRKADLVAEEAGRRHASPRTWWIASLFAIGAVCFAVGSTNAWMGFVSASVDAATFFVGSLFFTAAAYLSFIEVGGTPESLGRGRRRSVRLASFQPHRIDWWATGIQLIGTLLFNLSTFDAMVSDLDARQVDQLVWWPDVGGSVCFLVASYLAWAEICHSAGRLRVNDVSWWIGIVNLAGSILFGLSAVGARIVLSTGAERNASLVNFGTFWGAVGFLIGALLLIPEARRGLGDSSAAVA